MTADATAAIEPDGVLDLAPREVPLRAKRPASGPSRARRGGAGPTVPEWVSLGQKQKRCLAAIFEIYAGQWGSNHATRCMMRGDWVHFCKDVLHVCRRQSNLHSWSCVSCEIPICASLVMATPADGPFSRLPVLRALRINVQPRG